VASRIPAVFHLMNEGRTVFAQLLDFLPKYEFDKCVARYHGNRRVRKLPAYEQFLVLAFAARLSQWLLASAGTLPQALALDGKMIRDHIGLLTLAGLKSAASMPSPWNR
jgi:hypothetical protein